MTQDSLLVCGLIHLDKAIRLIRLLRDTLTTYSTHSHTCGRNPGAFAMMVAWSDIRISRTNEAILTHAIIFFIVVPRADR